MKRPLRIAFIGNSLPRLCGIATYTTDLRDAVARSRPDCACVIVAMTENGQSHAYPPVVIREIHEARPEEYLDAADLLNRGDFDVISLQHEFGIFGGPAGRHILALLDRLTVPVVTTFHTVLAEPSAAERLVTDRIIALSARCIVMADKGRTLLISEYGSPPERIDVIAHGIPDAPFRHQAEAKAQLGYAGRSVILTFGLISPDKGIEAVIDAMPEILKRCPDAVYVVLGATHPNLLRQQGEAYRQSLVERIDRLEVAESVVLIDRFVDLPTLLDHISMCDVYVTPYLNEAQMTSGTLSYSFGAGRAIVSTPYWHALELLCDGRGNLVPFGDSEATGRAIADLLTGEPRRIAMERRAYADSRAMIWPRSAERHLASFEAASAGWRHSAPQRPIVLAAPSSGAALATGTAHLAIMCDDVGIFQHAIHSVPDPAHGYCVDDNARALLLAVSLEEEITSERLPDALTMRFASFVQHAWNPAVARFRNFMSFDRRWLEEAGSEDSHGRTLWALGAVAACRKPTPRRDWAAALFAEAAPVVETFRPPRAWAFTLLGLAHVLDRAPGDAAARRLRDLLADRLLSILATVESDDWIWFENGLAYDNARLPEALLAKAASGDRFDCAALGLRSLRWLVATQTAPSGVFRPVGSDSFGTGRTAPLAFDQQPLEAAATVAACLKAWHTDGDGRWVTEADRAFAWFSGANDLRTPLVDPLTGACRDGLHPDRANENRGAESVLVHLLAQIDIRRLHALQDRRADRIGSMRRLADAHGRPMTQRQS